MPSVLITGANRGIGLEFARQYAADGWDVIATVRESSPELDRLGVCIEQLEMRDLDSVAAFASRVGGALDLLIANAGTWIPETSETAEDGRQWAEMMVTNCIGPYLLGKALLPRMTPQRGKLIAISSRMGSIADSSGGYVPYRTSKSALNMAWNALAHEARALGIAPAVLNPGWVKTRMGGPNAPMRPEDSIAQMRGVIDGLTLDQSGSFLNRDGTPIPW